MSNVTAKAETIARDRGTVRGMSKAALGAFVALVLATAGLLALGSPSASASTFPPLWTANHIGVHHQCRVEGDQPVRGRYTAICGQSWLRIFKPCAHRWSHGCMWDARRRHARGRSFIDIRGKNYYLKVATKPVRLPQH